MSLAPRALQLRWLLGWETLDWAASQPGGTQGMTLSEWSLPCAHLSGGDNDLPGCMLGLREVTCTKLQEL